MRWKIIANQPLNLELNPSVLPYSAVSLVLTTDWAEKYLKDVGEREEYRRLTRMGRKINKLTIYG